MTGKQRGMMRVEAGKSWQHGAELCTSCQGVQALFCVANREPQDKAEQQGHSGRRHIRTDGGSR